MSENVLVTMILVRIMGLLEVRGYRSSDRNVTYWDRGGMKKGGRKCVRAVGLDHKGKIQQQKKEKP